MNRDEVYTQRHAGNYNVGLPKAALEDGAYYRGACRNAEEARWNAEHNCFVHWRTKFKTTFLETIKHYEDEQHFDVFNAIEKIEIPEKEIPMDKYWE